MPETTTSYRHRNGTNGYHRNGDSTHTGDRDWSAGRTHTGDRDWSRYRTTHRYPSSRHTYHHRPTSPPYRWGHYPYRWGHYKHRRYNHYYYPHRRTPYRPWWYNWWDNIIWPWFNPIAQWFWPNTVPATYSSPYSPPIIYP